MLALHLSAAIMLAAVCHAQDWSTYRHDAARSGLTDAQVATPLALQWTHVPRHEPRPAWPEPGRELNRMAFDYAYQVAVADDTVFFGSSSDHAVRALHLTSGRERWSFFTGGPIRFAPMLHDGRVYVASDDGHIYCLNADDGALVWRFYGGPSRRMLMGNGQLISHHPPRSGVIVRDGVAYFTAGMWSSDGVYIYALDAEDGSVLWRNSTSGRLYLRQPHPPSKAFSGVSPQGYLVADADQLFVPTGRNVAAAFDLTTGELQYYNPGPNRWADRWGGTRLFAASDMVFGWRARPGGDMDVEMGEHDPWPKDGMAGIDAESGNVIWEFLGKLNAVVRDDILYASGGGTVTAHDFDRLLEGDKPEECQLWSTDHGRVYEMIMAADTLFVGGRDEVTAISATDGSVLWQTNVDSHVRGLAAVDGQLLASLKDGRVLCFGQDAGAASAEVTLRQAQPPTHERAATAAAEALDATALTEGFCVDLGAGGGELAAELAGRTQMRVWCIEADAAQADAARRALGDAGLYGARVTVHQGTLEDLGYPQNFADLIVVDADARDELGEDAGAMHQILRPGGGLAWIQCAGEGAFGSPDQVARWLRKGGVPRDEISSDDTAVTVRRAPLEGTGQWTHQYGNAARTGSSEDRVARVPLEMQWFGEPGPAMMVARHWRGPAPLCVDGRLFVIGQYRITAVDAYNGRELWTRELPAAGRFPVSGKGGNAVADGAAVYVATGDTCLRLDARTGETLATHTLPSSGDGESQQTWDYLGLAGDLLLGTGSTAGPLVALDSATGETRWTWEPQFGVMHDSVAVAGDRVFVIDALTPGELDRLRRRGSPMHGLSRMVALGARDGRALWTSPDILPRRDLRYSSGVLLATGDKRMSAYDAETGKTLTWGHMPMQRFPVIVGDVIYGQPYAYDLRTGERLTREHPLTGQTVPWSMSRTYGCGAVSGAPNLLAFRSGALGLYGLDDDSGVHNYGSLRAGCYVNAIIAAGMVLMPPGDASCTCSYNFQTTVALAPGERAEEWAVFSSLGAVTPVASASLNLGAPGDQRDDEGNIWLAFPRPAGVKVPVEVALAEQGRYWRFNADETEISGSGATWLYASGAEGIQTLKVSLGAETTARYLVRLHFAEPGEAAAGGRVFDVHAQGEPVLQGVDVASEAGGVLSALVREFEVDAREELVLAFEAAEGGQAPPILSAIELLRR